MEIKRLSPELTQDYLRFFDTTPHDDEVDEHKCYCACWSSVSSEGEDFSTAKSRRELAERYIAAGYLQGYLAYEQGKVVGWCNANAKADCEECLCGKMYLKPLNEGQPPEIEKVKSVFCFVVAPQMRRQGVARQLLARVCEDAKTDGFDYVESYPITRFVSTRADYMGPSKLYEQEGFYVQRDLGERLVMRKKL